MNGSSETEEDGAVSMSELCDDTPELHPEPHHNDEDSEEDIDMESILSRPTRSGRLPKMKTSYNVEDLVPRFYQPSKQKVAAKPAAKALQSYPVHKQQMQQRFIVQQQQQQQQGGTPPPNRTAATSPMVVPGANRGVVNPPVHQHIIINQRSPAVQNSPGTVKTHIYVLNSPDGSQRIIQVPSNTTITAAAHTTPVRNLQQQQTNSPIVIHRLQPNQQLVSSSSSSSSRLQPNQQQFVSGGGTLSAFNPSPLRIPVTISQDGANTPVIRINAPFIRANTPVIRTNTPGVTTNAPFIRTNSPYIRTNTPVVRTSTPLILRNVNNTPVSVVSRNSPTPVTVVSRGSIHTPSGQIQPIPFNTQTPVTVVSHSSIRTPIVSPNSGHTQPVPFNARTPSVVSQSPSGTSRIHTPVVVQNINTPVHCTTIGAPVVTQGVTPPVILRKVGTPSMSSQSTSVRTTVSPQAPVSVSTTTTGKPSTSQVPSKNIQCAPPVKMPRRNYMPVPPTVQRTSLLPQEVATITNPLKGSDQKQRGQRSVRLQPESQPVPFVAQQIECYDVEVTDTGDENCDSAPFIPPVAASASSSSAEDTPGSTVPFIPRVSAKTAEQGSDQLMISGLGSEGLSTRDIFDQLSYEQQGEECGQGNVAANLEVAISEEIISQIATEIAKE